jgi:hypothetical protein
MITLFSDGYYGDFTSGHHRVDGSESSAFREKAEQHEEKIIKNSQLTLCGPTYPVE